MKMTALISDLRNYWSAPFHSPQLPVWRQIFEMGLLYFFRRIGPNYYLQARWSRADIPFKSKWQYLNQTEYLQLIFRINPDAYRKASQHKLIEKSVLSLQRLPTPKFIGFVHALRGKCGQGHPIRNAAQLSELLLPYLNQRVCFKPVEGFGGYGFASYLIAPGNEGVALVRKEGENPINISEWWQANGQNVGGFLIESFLEQHSEMALLNASSVNTIRIWLTLEQDRCRVLGAYLRVGRKGSQVDNTSSGGIACPVDVESGRVREAFALTRPSYNMLEHPDSQTPLVGFQIPFWNEAKSLAQEALLAFPYMKLTGLDMAITPNGPSIIELNMQPDYDGCAWMNLSLKEQ